MATGAAWSESRASEGSILPRRSARAISPPAGAPYLDRACTFSQTITLDGDVDGGNALPDSLSGTFVLCLAHAEDFTAGKTPDAGAFN